MCVGLACGCLNPASLHALKNNKILVLDIGVFWGGTDKVGLANVWRELTGSWRALPHRWVMHPATCLVVSSESSRCFSGQGFWCGSFPPMDPRSLAPGTELVQVSVPMESVGRAQFGLPSIPSGAWRVKVILDTPLTNDQAFTIVITMVIEFVVLVVA